MKNIYVPYAGADPVATSVNGHRLLILSHDPESLEDGLTVLGADHIVKVAAPKSSRAQKKLLRDLAFKADAGIVIAPENIEIPEVIESLKGELPWIQ